MTTIDRTDNQICHRRFHINCAFFRCWTWFLVVYCTRPRRKLPRSLELAFSVTLCTSGDLDLTSPFLLFPFYPSPTSLLFLTPPLFFLCPSRNCAFGRYFPPHLEWLLWIVVTILITPFPIYLRNCSQPGEY